MSAAAEIDDLIRWAGDIPALPSTAAALAAASSVNPASNQELIRWVGMDPALSAMALRLANSNAQKTGESLGTISDAVARLGPAGCRHLAEKIPVGEYYAGIPSFALKVKDVVGSGYFVAELAAVLAERSRMVCHQRMRTAGILHNIGISLFALARPNDYAGMIIKKDPRDNQSLARMERDRFGFGHPELGGAMARHWALPDWLARCIVWHGDRIIEPHGRDAHTDLLRLAVMAKDAHSREGFRSLLWFWKSCGIPKSVLAQLNLTHTDISDAIQKVLTESMPLLDAPKPQLTRRTEAKAGEPTRIAWSELASISPSVIHGEPFQSGLDGSLQRKGIRIIEEV